MLWTIISFAIIITLVIVSHEFGHYIVGRLNGINVNEFTVGMGPALYKKKGKHTTFAIRLLPIGGACIFQGMLPEEDEAEIEKELIEKAMKKAEDAVMEDDSEEDDEWGDSDKNANHKGTGRISEVTFKEGDFGAAPVWGRIATVLAGPFFNFIFAFLLSLILVWFVGADIPVIQEVMEGYPAEAAGLESGDTILKINNEKIYLWREVSMISMFNVGKPLEIEYKRDNQKYTTTITPQFSTEDNRYYIGFKGGTASIDCKNLSVVKYAAIEVRYWFLATYRSIAHMVTGHGSKDDLAGPVGIADAIGDTIENTKPYGVGYVVLSMLNMVILLCVNVGVMNLIPFPALDGGRFVVLFVGERLWNFH